MLQLSTRVARDTIIPILFTSRKTMRRIQRELFFPPHYALMLHRSALLDGTVCLSVSTPSCCSPAACQSALLHFRSMFQKLNTTLPTLLLTAPVGKYLQISHIQTLKTQSLALCSQNNKSGLNCGDPIILWPSLPSVFRTLTFAVYCSYNHGLFIRPALPHHVFVCSVCQHGWSWPVLWNREEGRRRLCLQRSGGQVRRCVSEFTLRGAV